MGTGADFFAASIGFAAGGAVVWFFKTQILTFVKGAEAVVAKMKADLAALEAKVTAAKAAVTTTTTK